MALLIVAAGCSNSGRALPPAGPNQTQSIVTTTVATTAVSTPGSDGSGAPAVDGEGTDSTAVVDETDQAGASDQGDGATVSTLAPFGTGGAARSSTPGTVSAGADSQLPDAAGPLTLTAPWTNDGAIPAQYTCKGAGTSPAISWKNVMPSSTEVAIVFTDPDAADFVHWVVWGIPSSVSALAGGLPSSSYKQATNGFGAVGYGAPCPPAGTSHTYVMTLYELTAPLTLASGSTAADVIAQLDQEDINSLSVSGQATG